MPAVISWIKDQPEYLVGLLIGLILAFAGNVVLGYLGITPTMRDLQDARDYAGSLDHRVHRIEVVLKYSGADSLAAIELFP